MSVEPSAPPDFDPVSESTSVLSGYELPTGLNVKTLAEMLRITGRMRPDLEDLLAGMQKMTELKKKHAKEAGNG